MLNFTDELMRGVFEKTTRQNIFFRRKNFSLKASVEKPIV